MIITLICAPIVTGVVVSIITSPVASSGGTDKPSIPRVNFDAGVNLCAKFNLAVQCVLSSIGSDSYMTREPTDNLNGVPTCGGNLPGFMRWASSHAIPNADGLVLSVASRGRASVEVEDLRVSVLKRQPTPRTTQIDCASGEGGGPSNYIYATVILDHNPPSVSYYCGSNPCPVPNVTIEPGGSAQIHINAYGNHSLTEWVARIDLIINGKLETLNLGS